MKPIIVNFTAFDKKLIKIYLILSSSLCITNLSAISSDSKENFNYFEVIYFSNNYLTSKIASQRRNLVGLIWI